MTSDCDRLGRTRRSSAASEERPQRHRQRHARLIATCVIVVEVTDWQHDRNLRRRVQDHQRQDELTAQVDAIYQFERQLERSDEFYELDREWCRTNNIASECSPGSSSTAVTRRPRWTWASASPVTVP
jgi:hypothetical protein